MQLVIGNEAKDTITGFTGLIVASSTHLHNCDRVCLQPRELKDGQLATATWFDAPQVELIGPTDVKVITPVSHSIGLEDAVKDQLSGMSGVVTSIVTRINGCVRVGVFSGKVKNGSPVDDAWIPVQQLDIVASSVNVEDPKPKVGGPMKAPGAISNPK